MLIEKLRKTECKIADIDFQRDGEILPSAYEDELNALLEEREKLLEAIQAQFEEADNDG